MGLGITEMIGLAATLVFALPAGLLGVQLLVEGQLYLGGLLVAFAALMIAVPRYVTTPGDLPGEVAGKLLGAAVVDPDPDPDADGDDAEVDE
jgi:hypothetical protein